MSRVPLDPMDRISSELVTGLELEPICTKALPPAPAEIDRDVWAMELTVMVAVDPAVALTAIVPLPLTAPRWAVPPLCWMTPPLLVDVDMDIVPPEMARVPLPPGVEAVSAINISPTVQV